MKAVILGLINIYCRIISPALPPICRFQPTCSHYSYEAISTLGLARGGLFAIWRLLRCHPFTSGGFDPVPDVCHISFPKTKLGLWDSTGT